MNYRKILLKQSTMKPIKFKNIIPLRYTAPRTQYYFV